MYLRVQQTDMALYLTLYVICSVTMTLFVSDIYSQSKIINRILILLLADLKGLQECLPYRTKTFQIATVPVRCFYGHFG